MMHCATSDRLMNCSTERSQTALPSRLVKGFFSLSRKREDLPAAGKITAKLAMAETSSAVEAAPASALILRRALPIPPVLQPDRKQLPDAAGHAPPRTARL